MKIKIPFTERALELRFKVWEDPPQWFRRIFGAPVSSGVQVDEFSALRLAVVFACIHVISESVAQIPLKVYEKLPTGGKREAPEHPLYRLLHDCPNDEMTSFTWRESSTGHLCGWGNCYSFIDWGADGRPRSLELLTPDRVCPRRLDSGLLVYDVLSNKGQVTRYAKEQILHVPFWGYDGIIGYSPIRMMAESIGAAIAAQQHIGAFFKNGAVPAIVLTHPDHMSADAQNRFREDWESMHGGPLSAHRLAILEEGMKLETLSISPADAQLIDIMKLSRSQIAGIFRVPAHMINDLDKATFSNVDQLSIEFVKFSLSPWLERIEQTINRRLFLPSEQGRYMCEFVTDGLLRGDPKARNEAHRVAIMGGWKSINEVRAEENLQPIPGGDKHFMQSAFTTVDKIVAPEPAEPEPKLDDTGGGGINDE